MEDLNKDEQLLYLKIKTELLESVDNRVSDHLDRDRNLIKNTVSSVSRVFIWIIGLFSVLLTILGIKTYGDIKNAVKNSAKTSIEAELSKTDVLKQYDKRAKILYLNSLVESLLLKIEKSKYEKFSWNELSEENALFLIQALEDNNIDKETFNGILTILSEMRFESDVQEKLVEVIKRILSPSFNFDTYRTEKLSMLFKGLDKIDKEEFKNLARSYFQNTEETQNVRIAAMDFLKNVYDYEIIEDLEELAVSKNEELRRTSINSLSYLDFSNDLIENYISENKKGDMNLTKAGNILNIITESLNGIYFKSRRRFSYKPNESKEQECRDLAINNIKYLIDNGVRFSFEYDEKPTLWIYMNNRTSYLSGVNKDIFFKYHIESVILNDTKKSLQEFTKYLNGINNINSLRKEQDARVVAKVNDTLSLSFIDTEILGSDINGFILLELDKDEKLIAKWWDYSGILIKKEIKNLGSLEQFKLVSKKEIIEDNIWWR